MVEFWAYLILLLSFGIYLALRFYVYCLNNGPLRLIFLIIVLRRVFWCMQHFAGGHY